MNRLRFQTSTTSRLTFVSLSSFTGKEKDSESGYHYFGARYYDCEALTGWLSVDPMADKYPSLSPYNYCAWNPIKLVDPDGMDNYETDAITGHTTVERTNAKINTYSYKDEDGIIYNLGTYKKVGGKVKLPIECNRFVQVYGNNGKNYYGADETAGLLSAIYKYFKLNPDAEKIKINQLMTINNVHSGSRKETQCADIQYVSTNDSQGDTRVGNVDYEKCQQFVDCLRFFGFNDRAGNYNILTANKENNGPALQGTHLWNESEHRHHMHIQGFNKKYIKSK